MKSMPVPDVTPERVAEGDKPQSSLDDSGTSVNVPNRTHLALEA